MARLDPTGPPGIVQPTAEFAALLIESAPDGIVVTDRNGVITMVNRRTEELFGYPRQALIGKPVEILLPVGDRQVHTAHRLRYVDAPRARAMGGTLDLWARRADGAGFPVEVSLSPFQPGGGDLVIASVRDVSDRRAAEQGMRNMSHLLGAITEAVYLADPDTLAITYVNTAACHQTGYGEHDLLEMTPQQLLPDLDEHRLRKLVRALAIDAAPPGPITTVLRRRDGADRTVECMFDLPTAPRGQQAQLVMIVRDVTAQRAMEIETRAALESLALTNDRERIARDLHDTVIQDLFAAGLTLQATAGRAPPEVGQRIMDIVDRHDAIIRRLRITVFGLADVGHHADSLRSQVLGIVDESARILGFRPGLSVSGTVDAASTPTIAEQLVPSLREALSNVARHAQATGASVELEYAHGTLTMRLIDDGIGHSGTLDRAGNGLRTLTRRAELLGGALELRTTDPHGLTLVWTVPT